MFRAYNLENCNWSGVPPQSGDAIYKLSSASAKKSLESFLSTGIVNGSKLSNHWFPKIKADVFISHSHKDESTAVKCASWLKDSFGLESFVDSCLWGHADDLLKIIDKACLNPGGETYDYNKRNGSTSHVHMMLSTALSTMLGACECVIFINTPNSITSNEAVAKTQSPWLLSELGTMRIIRRKKPERALIQLENFSGQTKKAVDLTMEYIVPLDELTPLDSDQLKAWRASFKANPRKLHALDLLYEIAPE